jgi:type I secretion outer membrane protein, TolC family
VIGVVAAIWLAALAGSLPVAADTVESALVKAYQNNLQLNVQRALVRATDENVPQALSGYRPRVSATITGGEQSLSTTSQLLPAPPGLPAQYFTNSGYNATYSGGLTIAQTIFNGFQTANRTRAAEGSVFAARQTLRNTEQNVLLSALTAYMNVLRDYAILGLQKRNVEVLQEGLRETNDRFKVNDVTSTDVSQSESRLAGGVTQFYSAQSNYTASVATYNQVIGNDPGKLSPGTPVDRFFPATLDECIAVGASQHPAITSAMYNVDVAQHQVSVAEGALLPSFVVQGSAQKGFEPQLDVPETYSLSILGQLSVPIYQGGAEYSAVRQVKETLGQRRLELDLARSQVRQGIVQAWAQLEAAKKQISTTDKQVKAAESALNGVREEARVGQRTTLDVLNAQQELVNARVSVVTAQRDRVVASFTLLAAVGRLSPQILGLPVNSYNAAVHYQQVRDNWVGLRTPDGK